MSDDETFEKADAGASHVYPMEAGQLRKGGFVVIKGFPCKAMEISISKTGKHGHAKAAIVGIDIFTGKKYDLVSPTTHNIEVPNVTRAQYTCIDVSDDGFLTLLDDDGNTREDLQTSEPEKLQEIKELMATGDDVIVEVTKAMGIERVMNCKKGAAGEK
jgi:translation initiation factor 5A